MKTLTVDTLLIAGGASLAYGAWLAWEPAGFLMGGVLTMAAAILLARSM